MEKLMSTNTECSRLGGFMGNGADVGDNLAFAEDLAELFRLSTFGCSKTAHSRQRSDETTRTP